MDTLWQGERRAARLEWWKQVLDGPVASDGKLVFDEALLVRFGLENDQEPARREETVRMEWALLR